MLCAVRPLLVDGCRYTVNHYSQDRIRLAWETIMSDSSEYNVVFGLGGAWGFAPGDLTSPARAAGSGAFTDSGLPPYVPDFTELRVHGVSRPAHRLHWLMGFPGSRRRKPRHAACRRRCRSALLGPGHHNSRPRPDTAAYSPPHRFLAGSARHPARETSWPDVIPARPGGSQASSPLGAVHSAESLGTRPTGSSGPAGQCPRLRLLAKW